MNRVYLFEQAPTTNSSINTLLQIIVMPQVNPLHDEPMTSRACTVQDSSRDAHAAERGKDVLRDDTVGLLRGNDSRPLIKMSKFLSHLGELPEIERIKVVVLVSAYHVHGLLGVPRYCVRPHLKDNLPRRQGINHTLMM